MRTTSATTPPAQGAFDTPTVAQDPRFRFGCVGSDGRVLGDFSRLEEVWASTDYLRTQYCTARFVGSQPFVLTPSEAQAARIAAGGVEDPSPAIYLKVLEVCTRLGAEDGPHSIPGTPAPILKASLEVCPEAPQAGLVESWLVASQP
jgi:hypothetical protein